jgi:hypothetical protein
MSWMCTECTTRNPDSGVECAVCMAPPPPGTTPPPSSPSLPPPPRPSSPSSPPSPSLSPPPSPPQPAFQPQPAPQPQPALEPQPQPQPAPRQGRPPAGPRQPVGPTEPSEVPDLDDVDPTQVVVAGPGARGLVPATPIAPGTDPAAGGRPGPVLTYQVPVFLLTAVLLAAGAVRFLPGIVHPTHPNGGTIANVTAGGQGGPSDGQQIPQPVPTDTAASVEPPVSSPSAPTRIGVVTIDLVVGDDSRAEPIAQMLDTYFSGVNRHDANAALSVFDPAGGINANDPNEVSSFARSVSTTNDTDVVLKSIGPDPTGRGDLSIGVTFESHQSPGTGPTSDPNETCTDWTISYVLTVANGNSYRIRYTNADHQPC